MTSSIAQVSLLLIGYLLVLFAIAYSADKGWIPQRLVRNPTVFILSLGSFASAWAYYGVIDLAFQFGYGALAYYLGACTLFLFSPLLITPLALLANRFQISNLADLMVFRFHSHSAGRLTAACMTLVFLPLMVLQLQAVADTLQIMTATSAADLDQLISPFNYREALALLYCVILGLFTIAFGSNREKAPGLMLAMAFDTVIKVVALLAVGLLAVYGVFGGLGGLDQWLRQHPENLELLYTPAQESGYHTLVLVFLASSLAMPHIFQISATGARVRQAAAKVSWGFPLLFLLLALPVFPILWAGFALDVALPAQYFTLGVPMQSGSLSLTLLAFLGGLSAASGALITLTLALGTMLINQWLLPASRLGWRDFYKQLSWLRAIVISALFALSFVLYQILDSNFSLTDLAIISFIEALQFLPGIVVVNYWPRAHSRGYIAGLSLGTLVWLVGLVMPTLTDVQVLQLPFSELAIPLGIDYWNGTIIISFLANLLALVLVSLGTQSSVEERYSAELCTEDELSNPLRMILDIHSADQFVDRLSASLGPNMAQQEVHRALAELGLNESERRPYALRRLRDRLEANLSGLVGTAVASEVLDKRIPYHLPEETRPATDINLVENRLNQYRSHLSGLASELNNLRLYHRNTIEELPLAVCSLGQNNEILMWNRAMERLTGIAAETVVGSYLSSLYGPWIDLLAEFSDSPHQHLHKHKLKLDGRAYWISLHKASIQGPAAEIADGQIILLEDMTETQLLEQELVHTERLASVGRLAAGVAHEIGNPITGIDCLAQNLRYETDDPQAVRETADQILSQTERVTRIVQSLVSFSHAGNTTTSDYAAVSLHACANEAIALLKLQKEEKEVRFNNSIPPDLKVSGDAQKLIQVFVNLLSNARDASPGGGVIRLTASSSGDQAEIQVDDAGSGIPREHLKRVLEPFYTTKDPGKGTGLGLAMVYSIIEEHHGQLNIRSPLPDTDQGTRVSIKLPLNLETKSNTGNTTKGDLVTGRDNPH